MLTFYTRRFNLQDSLADSKILARCKFLQEKFIPEIGKKYSGMKATRRVAKVLLGGG
jgi:hypothetical protein